MEPGIAVGRAIDHVGRASSNPNPSTLDSSIPVLVSLKSSGGSAEKTARSGPFHKNRRV